MIISRRVKQVAYLSIPASAQGIPLSSHLHGDLKTLRSLGLHITLPRTLKILCGRPQPAHPLPIYGCGAGLEFTMVEYRREL